MTVTDKNAIAAIRDRADCECCGRHVWPLEVHHCFVKTGMGSGRRLDIRCNLIALTLHCHNKAEHSTEFNDSLKEIIARREKTTVEAITDYLNVVLFQTDKSEDRPPPPWETWKTK